MTYEEARRLADAIEEQQPGWIGMVHRLKPTATRDDHNGWGVVAWDHTTGDAYSAPYTFKREPVPSARHVRERRATA